VLARIRVAVDVREDHRAGIDAVRGEPLHEGQPMGAVLGVDADRRTGARVRHRRGLEHRRLERRHPVVAGARLDEAGADRRAVHAVEHLGGEAIGQRRGARGAQRVVRGVVRVAVGAGRGDDMQTRRARDLEQALRIAPEPERRPVHERAAARGGERARLLDRLAHVEEVLPRLDRRGEEEVLVRVARPELRRIDVAGDRPHDRHRYPFPEVRAYSAARPRMIAP
jgi:hypothetical protein